MLAPQNPQQESAGEPGRWNMYFAADDARDWPRNWPIPPVQLEFGPEEMGDTGVMVFFAPPGGGTTGVWQAGTHFGAARSNEPGALAWAELLTPEPQAAVGFFQQLFGHEVTEYPQDDGGTYTTLMVNGTEVAGIARVPGDARTPASRGGRCTSACPTSRTRSGRSGCGRRVLIEPEEGEEAGTIATLQDPQGGVFSLLEV